MSTQTYIQDTRSGEAFTTDNPRYYSGEGFVRLSAAKGPNYILCTTGSIGGRSAALGYRDFPLWAAGALGRWFPGLFRHVIVIP